jgi:SAM-dependent methyltransferase
MDDARKEVEDQAKLWNGAAGRGWVEAQALLDRMLQPFEDLLVSTIPSGSQASVLDVGCGTGSTTLALSRRLGPKGRCTGIDISEPMLAAARARAEDAGSVAEFVCDDAQEHPFANASFDAIVSRFGVMFFDDSVGAFANLRRAARAGAELRFVAWRSAGENPFMTTAERAAAPFMPSIPPRRPDAPGQFAFADGSRVARILEAGGWSEIDIQPIDAFCTFPARDLTRYLSWVGPVGRVLGAMNDRERTRALERIRPAFDPYVRGTDVCFNAACWMVGARATAAGEGGE